ncbi:GntR family transcriptional regulator [Micromonospora parva]|uniref:GntR family transcriptional regulator n=1 Tax=Micromonospora parva TaxID=1464048 RepID=UPI003404AE5B
MPTPHYGQPRYRVIADELRERISSGAIPPGALLPTESALTAEFRASRGTIRQAIAILRDEHMVATEHGRGTYASPFWLNTSLEGGESETRHRQVAAGPDLAALFAVDVGTTVVERETVRRMHGVVCEVVRTYRPLRPGQ